MESCESDEERLEELLERWKFYEKKFFFFFLLVFVERKLFILFRYFLEGYQKKVLKLQRKFEFILNFALRGNFNNFF